MTHPLPRRLSKPGPILNYLMFLHQSEQKHPKLQGLFESTIESVKTALSTPEGAILLDLLEKSTQDFRLSPDAEPRALDALNAQSFIALDLRRIVSDELEKILAQNTDMGAR